MISSQVSALLLYTGLEVVRSHGLDGHMVGWPDGRMATWVGWSHGSDGLMGRMVSRVGCPDTLRLCLGVT